MVSVQRVVEQSKDSTTSLNNCDLRLRKMGQELLY